MSVHRIPHSIMAQAVNYAFDHAIPLFCTLELSQKCNFSCRHCYNFDRLNGTVTSSVLLEEQWLNIIDQIIEEGAFYIALTGGEPLLVPYLFSLIERIRYHHCIPRIKTNGALLTQKMCHKLKEGGVNSIDVSLYGASTKSYQQFCGVDSFEQVVKGIHNAVAADIEVVINILLHKGNYKELPQMIAIAQKYQLWFNISDEITERYDHTGGDTLWRLEEQELTYLLRSELKDYFLHDNSEREVQCSCARTVCGVSAKGEVFPCIGAPIYAGNLLEQSFSSIWRRSHELNKIRNLTDADFSACQQCEVITTCNRSSGTAYVNTGNYTGCDPYSRLMAKLRNRIK